MHKKIKGIKYDALNILMDYPFPGNVRELINLIDSIYAIKQSGYIEIEDILNNLKGSTYLKNKFVLRNVEETKRERIILSTLKNTNWNYKKTAEILNLSERHLYRLIKKYNIKK